MSSDLLTVRDLEVTFALRTGNVKAIQNLSFRLEKGERLGIVGESGAGKSIIGFSILNLISPPGRISGGEIYFEGKDLTQLSDSAMREVRGNQISMIFQDPMMTLNPALTIGTQLIEIIHAHRKMSNRSAKELALEKLQLVQIPSPEERLKQYPHELSGGMCQRVVIACALMGNPSLIIADEPTTALDVTIQAEIMDLLLELCTSHNVGLILITHDLSVVSQMTQKIAVMYSGKIVEIGHTENIIRDPQHPYTFGLLKAVIQKRFIGKRLRQIPGNMPPLGRLPTGCAFHPRCSLAEEHCQFKIPELLPEQTNYHQVACHQIDHRKLL